MDDDCSQLLAEILWHGIPKCPYCSSTKYCAIPNNRYHCNSCNTSFSITAQTMFHQTRIPLKTWFRAIRIVQSSTRHVSSRYLASQIGVNKNTGYRIMRRINSALFDPEQRQIVDNIFSIYKGE
jgi:transposase-like protein